MPADIEMVPIARTIGLDRVVDEFVFRCAQSVRMDWPVPDVEATGRRLEIPTVVSVDFRDARIAADRTYQDQSSVLDDALPGRAYPFFRQAFAVDRVDPAFRNPGVKHTNSDERHRFGVIHSPRRGISAPAFLVLGRTTA
jgi:hypothetical protein